MESDSLGGRNRARKGAARESAAGASRSPLHRWQLPRRSFRPRLRDRLAVRLARLQRWEFWSAWAFYPPIVAYIIWLGIRYRSPLAFTAANPGIEGGGLVGERKADCLLPLAERLPERVATLVLLPRATPLAERLSIARTFVAANGGYPAVLKPDVGQRGRGVAIIRDAEMLEEYLTDAPGDVLLQRYIDGAEFGVFAYRRPSDGAVVIYSVTGKRFPSVTGDGSAPLHALIRNDARAWLIAPLLWRKYADCMEWVPTAGEKVPLVEIGAHCRGSLFLDASSLATEALRLEIAGIFDALPGFHFGRLDLRCPSAEALACGEGLRVLEINGVSAEAAHIYQPGTPLRRAYQSMLQQWRIAFEIGVNNIRNGGARPLTAVGFFRRLLEDHLRSLQWF
jgi:hypothetical protein